MRPRIHIAVFLGALLLSLPLEGRAELDVRVEVDESPLQADEAPAEEAEQESDSQPATPAPEPSESPWIERAIRCVRVICVGAATPRRSAEGVVFEPNGTTAAGTVWCRCEDDELRTDGQGTPPEAQLQPHQTASEEDAVLEPPPVSGFLVGRRDVGIRVELGYPFLHGQLVYGVHERVEIGVGYRGLYGMTNGAYGSLRIGLYANAIRSASVALQLLGGYTHTPKAEGAAQWTAWVGGDSGFGEASLAVSVGRYRHSFTVDFGARLGWVREQPSCPETEYSWNSPCRDRLFEDGDGGLMVVAFFDMGYAVRLSRLVSFYLATGFDAFTRGDGLTAFVRQRLGLLIDF